MLHDEPTVLYIFQNTPSIVSACRNQFNHYKTWIYSISVFYITLKHNRIILYHIWYLLHDEPTVLYIPEYSQYVFQHAALNLMTKSSEFTLFQYYYNTLKHNRIILCHIWYLLHDEPTVLYIFQILPVLISTCWIEFNHYKVRIHSITVFYNTLKHNRIILYHIWYLLHDEPTVLYIFRNTPSIDISMP